MLDGFDLGLVRADYWWRLATALVVIGLVVWLSLRRQGAWRVGALTIAGLLALRIVLVGNPLSWHLYARLLDEDALGWRHYALILVERNSYFVPTPELRYLAVGSSQTDAIYGNRAQQLGVEEFIVAGMMPMDFVLYADEIELRRPQTVLLYLSDFDVAKRPSAEQMVLSPRQGTDLVRIVRHLRGYPRGGGLYRATLSLAVGDVLPEYKFRFVFRGILDQQLRRMAATVGTANLDGDGEYSREQLLERLRGQLTADYVAFNLVWLEDFLRRMQACGVAVVIVEGQYNPLVTDARTTEINTHVREQLEQLAASFDGVRYLPATEVERFTTDDYMDLTHVTPEAGDRFTQRLFEVLEQPAGAAPGL
jgi:hypothetical protein